MTLEDGEFYRPLAALYKKNKVLSPAMKQFLAVLEGREVGRLELAGAYFRFAGLSGFKSCGTNIPFLRISSPSNQISPPPHSGR